MSEREREREREGERLLACMLDCCVKLHHDFSTGVRLNHRYKKSLRRQSVCFECNLQCCVAATGLSINTLHCCTLYCDGAISGLLFALT